MRSGPDRRCASYCTWSSRSRTTVLESADDQWRTPVTRGNLDNSCAEAGELAGSPASEIASEASFASVAGGAGAVAVGGATDAAFAIAPAGVTGIFSRLIIALLSCAVFSFHQTPPANAAVITTHISRIRAIGLRFSASGSRAAILN